MTSHFMARENQTVYRTKKLSINIWSQNMTQSGSLKICLSSVSMRQALEALEVTYKPSQKEK